MDRLIAFRVEGEPIGMPRLAQSGRGRRRRATVPRDSLGQQHPVVSYKLDVARCAKAAVKDFDEVARCVQQPEWMDGYRNPIRCKLVFVLPRPQKLRRGPRRYAPVKPDYDNLEKAVCDAMKEIMWQDDAQIVLSASEKWYAATAEVPHVLIEIEQLDYLLPKGYE